MSVGSASEHRLRRRGRARTRLRAQRIAAVVVLALLVPPAVSYVRTMLEPSSSSLGVRSVEWLRDHGAAWLVNDVERFWYSLNAPSTGGPPLRALPHVGEGGPVVFRIPHRHWYRPARVRAIVRPRLPGEGTWHPTGPRVAGAPPILVTTFRPDPSYPQLVAGVAWIDHTRTRVRLYPGLYQPPSAANRGPTEVPPSSRRDLLATFNSGFKLTDSRGGFIARGAVDAPLVPGEATLVGYRSGKVDVRAWRGGPRGGPGVIFARQNLPLIVDHGRPSPNLSDGPEWGFTVGNAIRVWRSGVGVDRRGDLIYAAANDQTVGSLAAILVHAGAVRAMELDINSAWISFNAYARHGARDPIKLLPDISAPSTRYLSSDDRDFFAVFASRP